MFFFPEIPFMKFEDLQLKSFEIGELDVWENFSPATGSLPMNSFNSLDLRVLIVVFIAGLEMLFKNICF